MTDAYLQFRQSKYFASLDGLRAISIMAVVWHHSGYPVSGVLSRGYLGVQLFFAISGFLITTLLLRESEANGHISLGAFYIRRTLRIFPLYYATIGLYVLIVCLSERWTERGALFFANLPAYLTYTSNWFVDPLVGKSVIFDFAWSLATEEQFYLCWPSVVRFARSRYVPAIVISALLLVGELSRFARAQHLVDSSALLPRALATIASPICLGCLGAMLLHQSKGFKLAYRIAGRPWSSLLAVVLLIAVFSREVPGVINAPVMTYAVIALVVRKQYHLRALFDNPVARYVGSISYGMYPLNMLALNVVRKVLGSQAGPLAYFFCTTALVVTLASIFYYGFEVRFLKLKQRFAHDTVAPRRASAGRWREAT